jgi:hypothetical protein
MMDRTLKSPALSLSDPARFARALRTLARDAHRALGQDPDPAALRALRRRADALASALGDRRGGPLAAWLDGLRRELRAASLRAGACGALGLGA